MDFPTKQSEIFIRSTLQSAFDLLSAHIQKQPSLISPSELSQLHQSLLQILRKKLSFSTEDSTRLLTQLKDTAYAADDLVDDLEYKSLQREVEEFVRSHPNEPITGPSVSQFKGFQTGEFDVRDGDQGGNLIHYRKG